MRHIHSRLRDKVVLITGSGGSIGRAACLRFAAEGARVIGCDVDPSRGEEALEAVRSAGGSDAIFIQCDLTDPNQASELIAKSKSVYGAIDVLYNNAAMAHFSWFTDMSFETFSRTMREEVDLVFHACKSIWPVFIKQGRGVIINTASVSAHICYKVVPGLAHSTAKSGILAMSRHLAMEGAPHGIRVNSISPGLILTNQSRALLDDPEWASAMQSKIMLDRIGQPEDVAAAAAFLASDDAKWITGTDLAVDGGTTAW